MGACFSRFKQKHIPLEEVYTEPIPITPLRIRIPKEKDEELKLEVSVHEITTIKHNER